MGQNIEFQMVEPISRSRIFYISQISPTCLCGIPCGSIPKQPDNNIDPGRVRFEPLFVAMYGDCRHNEVSKNLRTIEWLPKHYGGNVKITKNNGVDTALDAVSRDLDELPVRFYQISDTDGGHLQLSTCRRCQLYVDARVWRGYRFEYKICQLLAMGSNPEGEPKWKNQIPIRIVRIFENHGFIWGGYWYHYDTMHFEYRPELFLSEKIGG